MAHSHEIYIYMHMYVRREPHLPRTQETKSPELYVAFDPLTCSVYTKTQNVTLFGPKPGWKERSGPPKVHSFSQGHTHINKAKEQ